MANNVRKPEDLERKYNFASLLGLSKNVKMNEKSLTKVNNELANMLNALIINLKDVLDNQSDISLWFYSGIPSTSDEPFISWNNPSEHYGDIYYDQKTGYVYQFSENGWNRNTDATLIQAMALTNVELDTTTDHERKVYFTQPVPPYSSGDWWILEDGTLKTCQLGRTSGSYDAEDFIIANKYVPTVASTDGDIITIKHGQVIKMSDTFASFEDLATGGKTVINGANIKTGTINTDNVTIGNGNVLIDDEGLKLSNGAKVVGEYGMFTNLQFNGFGISEVYFDTKSAGEYKMLGYMPEDISNSDKYNICIDVSIPDNFTIVSAYILLRHIPYLVEMKDGTEVYGYARNIKCYIERVDGKIYVPGLEGSEYNPNLNGVTYSEISNCFNTSDNSYTPTAPTSSNYKVEEKITNNIAAKIIKKSRIKISSTNPIPSTAKGCFEQTGFVFAQLNVFGYMQYN